MSEKLKCVIEVRGLPHSAQLTTDELPAWALQKGTVLALRTKDHRTGSPVDHTIAATVTGVLYDSDNPERPTVFASTGEDSVEA